MRRMMVRNARNPFSVLSGSWSSTQWKLSGRGPHSAHFDGRADQKILGLLIQTTQRPDHIANIGAHAEFRHSTDVDGHSHEANLTTQNTDIGQEFQFGSSTSL